jgi:hypothetical protein
MSTEPFPATNPPPTPGEPTNQHTVPPLGSDPAVNDGTPAIILEAHAAFLADLPEMLRDHYKQWVAYHGKHRIGFGQDSWALEEECVRQGYDENELLIYLVYPYPEMDYISAL